jgi:hypothetical protein
LHAGYSRDRAAGVIQAARPRYVAEHSSFWTTLPSPDDAQAKPVSVLDSPIPGGE